MLLKALFLPALARNNNTEVSANNTNISLTSAKYNHSAQLNPNETAVFDCLSHSILIPTQH